MVQKISWMLELCCVVNVNVIIYESYFSYIFEVLLTRELRDELNYTGRITKLSNLMKMRNSQKAKILKKKQEYFAKYGLKHKLMLPAPCYPLDQWQVFEIVETMMPSSF